MCMQKYFKKPSGVVIELKPNHDLESLKSRFKECNKDGSDLVKKAKPKTSKKKVEDK